MILLNIIKLIYRTAFLKIRGVPSDHTSDYNIAAATYDEYYSRYLRGSSEALLERLPLSPGMKVLDLACGTGFFSHHIAKRIGSQGRLVAVDLSSGMLSRNQENAAVKKLSNITFVESDALKFLRSQEDNSLDGVVCGWGICYMDHAEFQKEVERTVKPGGFVGIIENRACTLKAVSKLFSSVMLRYPEALVKNMVIDLPRNHQYLKKTICKGRLKAVHAWHANVSVPCKDGKDVVDYMVKSGASAGFLDALDKKKFRDILDDLVKAADTYIDRRGSLPVMHESCALLATKSRL